MNLASLELPTFKSSDQENHCAGAVNPLTPELFCRSLSSGSLPSQVAQSQAALTKSYSARGLNPCLIPKIRV
eukprot:8746318-Pyramimonas_sp.AAC.1